MTTESESPGGKGEPPSRRSDLQLIERALRNDWPIPPDLKRQLLQRAVEICDPETEVGAAARPRLVLGALKVISRFCELNVKQQAVDIARERLDQKKGRTGQTLAELVAEAEAVAAEHTPAERPAETET